ncbi:MAG: undecaprenyl-diphosphatase UppP [Trichlorobacter sp.]
MNFFHAALLGLIQGTTEVLPISSSAHLILVPRLLGWAESGITFDVALHFGTFVALFTYFRRDVVSLVQDGLSGFFQDDPGRTLRLPWLLVAGSVPAAVAGKLFEEPIEQIFRDSPLLIALLLVLFGLGLGLADRYGRQHRGVHNVTLNMALIIGSFQALALLPGVSRSGITITAALLVGLARPEAARFSFLLSLPIVFGAALLKGLQLLKTGIEPGMLLPMLVGISVAAISGYASVAFLLRFVQTNTVWPFVWYRLAAGGLLLAGISAGLLR